MKSDRPNILLVTTDQQRADTVHALGNPVIRTPTLDRLAREGTAFTRAYTPSPVCVPARCALVTGMLPHATGCVDNGSIPEGLPSLMQCLADAGYQTHGTGKMHFSPDPFGQRLWGFQGRDFSEEGQLDDDYTRHLWARGYRHVLDPRGLRGEYYYLPQPSQVPADLHNTAWVADRSIDFLARRDARKPFFLWSSFIKPHPPFESPTPWNRLYRSVDMPDPLPPDEAGDFTGFWNRVQNRYKYMDGGSNPHLARTIRAAYYGSISFLDFHLGRILDALGSALDDTVVLFTSDHGELLGDYGCVGKRCMLEASVRVPFLARHPPTFAAGARCATAISLIDLFPTVNEIAAGGTSSATDGPRLAQIAAGADGGRAVTSQFSHRSLGLHMITNGNRKYVHSAADVKEWGFALDDPLGEAPLAIDDPSIAGLKRQLLAQLSAAGADTEVAGGNWRSYGRSEIPANLREGLIFQDPPELYDALGRLDGYGEPRRQTWKSLIDLTAPAAMDPRTGKNPLSVDASR